MDGSLKSIIPNGAYVFIPGGATSTTDDNGNYSLHLDQCQYCGPGATLTIKVNSDHGFAETEYVVKDIEGPQPFDLTVVKNDDLSLTGIVRERSGGPFLSGIKVSAVVPNYPGTLPSTNTDKRGIFQIPLRKAGIANQTGITITLMDPTKQYREKKEFVPINRYARPSR